ncbi:MAG: dihydrolipoamide acetyltransferase family protein [Candidatus Limnocylindrales bacterium]
MPRVTMPQLGESVAEGTIGRWLKQVGDRVTKYEPIVEVITDKVNAEVPSPYEGILSEILVEEGATVPNGAEIAVIEEAGEVAPGVLAAPAESSAPAESPAAGAAARPEAGPVPAPASPGGAVAQVPPPASAAPAPAVPVATPATPAPATSVSAPPPYEGPVTPAVRRLAREQQVDLALVRGTGHGGRVTREDVLAFVAARATVPAQPPAAPASVPSLAGPVRPSEAPSLPAAPAPSPLAVAAGEGDFLEPLSQMRRGIAAQMTRALSVPMAYLTLEVDMSGVVALRERVKREYEAREGIALSYVAFVTKAAVEALRRHPGINAHWTDQGLLRRAHINVSVAVAVDDGLIAPVIHDADRLSINGLNRAVAELAERARGNRLRLEDLQGGTFTVDNTGWFGSVVSQPIVNVPEIAILTMEAIQRRPVVVDTPAGEAIAIRPRMYICSSFDHRATDGAQMGRFMQDVKGWLESVDEQTAVW